MNALMIGLLLCFLVWTCCYVMKLVFGILCISTNYYNVLTWFMLQHALTVMSVSMQDVLWMVCRLWCIVSSCKAGFIWWWWWMYLSNMELLNFRCCLCFVSCIGYGCNHEMNVVCSNWKGCKFRVENIVKLNLWLKLKYCNWYE